MGKTVTNIGVEANIPKILEAFDELEANNKQIKAIHSENKQIYDRVNTFMDRDAFKIIYNALRKMNQQKQRDFFGDMDQLKAHLDKLSKAFPQEGDGEDQEAA